MTVRATGVQAVALSFEAFNARDLDLLLSLTHPHCEWFPFRAQLEGTSYQGHQGVRRFFRDMDEDWERFTIEPVELTARDEVVMATGHVTGRSSTTGVEIDFVGGFVFGLRDDLIMRITSFSDPAQAREAAGLNR